MGGRRFSIEADAGRSWKRHYSECKTVDLLDNLGQTRRQALDEVERLSRQERLETIFYLKIDSIDLKAGG